MIVSYANRFSIRSWVHTNFGIAQRTSVRDGRETLVATKYVKYVFPSVVIKLLHAYTHALQFVDQ